MPKAKKVDLVVETALDEILRAKTIVQKWSHNDATSMLQIGFKLAGICARPNEEEPYIYTLISDLAPEEFDQGTRELWRF